MRLPHLDAAEDVFRLSNDSDLERIKVNMISGLIREKKLDQWKFNGYYAIGIDGTGMASFDNRHCDCCLQKISKNGATTYFHNVLYSMLLTPTELSLSIATEWINNEGKTEFEKQDCKREAFKRLSQKIKKHYLQLPIVVVTDGHYPWDGFFEICNKIIACNSISFTGRLRQKIENEGFNSQKNHGYALEHKFSRISFNVMKIYYQCHQIAHIINQFVEPSVVIKNLQDTISKCTIKYLWKRLLSYLLENVINQDELNEFVSKPFQIRLA